MLLKTRRAVCVKFQPDLRVIFFAVRELEIVILRVRRKESKDLLVSRRRLVFLCFLIRPGGGAVFDVTWKEGADLAVQSQADGVVFVATFTAKMKRVEPLVGLARQELLSLDGDLPFACRFKSCVCVSGSRNKLVQFESKEALGGSSITPGAILLRKT